MYPTLTNKEQNFIIKQVKINLSMGNICIIPARGGSKRIPKKYQRIFWVNQLLLIPLMQQLILVYLT